MLNSSQTNLVRLEVRTPDPATEIFVIDGQFHLVGRALGRLSLLVEPSIYKVKVRIGFETQEEYVVLPEDGKEVVKEFSAIRFSSPAPLNNTAKTHDSQIWAAYHESSRIHVQVGQGSWIFVFARNWTSKAPEVRSQHYPHPAKGLTLRDMQGNVITDFTVQSTSELFGDSWAACNVQVDPGFYRLHLEMSLGTTLEQIIVASSGWQTQVFLLQYAYGPEPQDRHPDLLGASILLSKDLSFNPNRSDMRLAEMARLGMTNKRQVLSDHVRQMLRNEFDNPMLGLYGAHLLLLDKEPDLRLLGSIVANLRRLLGVHPDVEALALLVEPSGSSYVFEVPPMLRGSWSLVINATVANPDLVPLNSLAANIADYLWGNEIWLTWRGRAREEAARLISGTIEAESVLVSSELEVVLRSQFLQANPQEAALTKQDEKLRSIEKPFSEAYTSLPEIQIDDNMVKRLVHILGIPRANVENLLDRLIFDRALMLDPKQADTWVTEGMSLGEREQFAGAAAAFERSLALNPNNAIAWRNKRIMQRKRRRTMWCSDPFLDYLRSLGYSVIRSPKANIRPLQMLSKQGKDLHLLGELTTLLVPEDLALLPPIKNNQFASGASGQKTGDVSIGLGTSLLSRILGAMGGSDVRLDAMFRQAKSLVFEIHDVLEDKAELVRLDQYLASVDVNPFAHYVEELLEAEELYVITSTIKSKKITIEAKTADARLLKLSVPDVQSIVGSNVKISGEANNTTRLTIEGGTPLVFGFQAVQIFYNKGHFSVFEPQELGFSAPGETSSSKELVAAGPFLSLQ